MAARPRGCFSQIRRIFDGFPSLVSHTNDRSDDTLAHRTYMPRVIDKRSDLLG
jgi:hypothetical protein